MLVRRYPTSTAWLALAALTAVVMWAVGIR